MVNKFINAFFLMIKRASLHAFLFCIILSVPAFASGIYVNKSGYLPDSPKLAYFDFPADSFYVYRNSDNIRVFGGSVLKLKENDPTTGLTTYRGDFTEMKIPGQYYIAAGGSIRSSVFEISDSVYSDVFKKSLEAFYFQRCGTALYSGNAGLYQHPACHKYDGFFHFSTDTSGFKPAAGGWHDAGDYGKYVVNAGITVGTMLLAYELFPESFAADNLNIPESGNNIPDILDEVKYELDWLLQMQSKSGGVYAKLTRENFSGFVMPQADNATRSIYEIASTATGDFAAVMAMASRVYSEFDKGFADSCLSAAKNAWDFLSSHASIVPLGGFKNPIGTSTGEYGDGSDSDERLWAAAELFYSTGESEYNNYFVANYKKSGLFSSTMSWNNLNNLALLSYIFNTQGTSNESIKSELKNSLYNYCGTFGTVQSGNGLNVAMNAGEFYWGSNATVLNKAVLLISAFKLNGDQSFYNAALSQLNYILGINPHNISYVSGVGDKYPMHPHHRPSAADGIIEPVPGMLAGGPNQYLQDNVLAAKFNNSTPPALCYIDDQESYASNEIAINWNAPLVFVAGFFNGSGIPVSVGKNDQTVKSSFCLEQNYPNPFNPETTIKYSFPDVETRRGVSLHTTITLYDLLGREVKTLVNESKSPGEYSVKFDGAGYPSGIYLYRIESGEFNEVKKMLLVK